MSRVGWLSGAIGIQTWLFSLCPKCVGRMWNSFNGLHGQCSAVSSDVKHSYSPSPLRAFGPQVFSLDPNWRPPGGLQGLLTLQLPAFNLIFCIFFFTKITAVWEGPRLMRQTAADHIVHLRHTFLRLKNLSSCLYLDSDTMPTANIKINKIKCTNPLPSCTKTIFTSHLLLSIRAVVAVVKKSTELWNLECQEMLLNDRSDPE